MLNRPRLSAIPNIFFTVVLIALVSTSSQSRAQGFPAISPDELKMTSEPMAPGAHAIILFHEVVCNDNGMTSHEDHYMRIKILAEEGRSNANVEIIFNKSHEDVVNIHGRTIQPDGSVVEYHDEIPEKTIEKAQGLRELAKTFTLPNVQVGSIIEYRYTLDLNERLIFVPHWILSSSLFTKNAKFTFRPFLSGNRFVHVRWVYQGLPAGAEPKEGPDHIIRMEVQNIPAFQVEDFMPPVNELKARVDFIYEDEFNDRDPEVYWRHVGKVWNDKLESFVGKRKVMEDAVGQIVSPSDPPEAKLRKIYDRVQQVRNTTYEVRKSAEELKRAKEKPAENVEQVWKDSYGSSTQLNWLFLGLVRAAGFDAYGVWVSNRHNYFFFAKTMESRKLSTNAVLIKLDGKNLFFSPGIAFAPFGMLPWYETATQGLCLDKDGGTWVSTTLPASAESRAERVAKLTLTENGTLEGKVTVTYTGLQALYYRNDARNSDDVARKRLLENALRRQVPVTSEVELTGQPEWSNSETPLIAEFHISIPGWGSNAGKKTAIPSAVFSAPEKRLFEHAERVHPLYIDYPYERLEDVTIEVPTGWQIENVPEPKEIDAHVVSFSAKVGKDHTTLHLTRKVSWEFLLLEQKYYPALRNLFQTIRTNDERQILLTPAAAAAGN